MTLFLHFDGGFSMADSILDSITEQYHSLTKSGKKLADYVFSHTTETQYLSITSLAENMQGIRSYHNPFLPRIRPFRI